MEYFFDTSALIKAFHNEPGSTWVRHTLSDPHNQNFVSRLVVPESLRVRGYHLKLQAGASRIDDEDVHVTTGESSCGPRDRS